MMFSSRVKHCHIMSYQDKIVIMSRPLFHIYFISILHMRIRLQQKQEGWLSPTERASVSAINAWFPFKRTQGLA